MKLRTVFVTRHSSYPPIGGAALRNWQNISILSELGEVFVFEISIKQPSNLDVPSIPGVSECHTLHIAGGQRSRINRAVSKNFWMLSSDQHPWIDQVYFNKEAQAEFEKFLKMCNAQLVIIEELWLARYMRVVKKLGIPVVLDQHNAEGILRKEIVQSSADKISVIQKLRNHVESRNLLEIEKNAMTSADQTWVCGPNDLKSIKHYYGLEHSIRLVPNGVAIEEYKNLNEKPRIDAGSGSNPVTLFYPATFGYAPNAEAAEYLLGKILPKLKDKLKNFKVSLVGKNPTELMLKAAKSEPVEVPGMVPDMLPYWSNADIIIVPLLSGGGTRLKILEAFAARKPVVSTAKGAEGIGVKDGHSILLAESDDEFVDAILKLNSDKILAEKLVSNAFDLVDKHYSRQAVGERIKKNVEELFLSR